MQKQINEAAGYEISSKGKVINTKTGNELEINKKGEVRLNDNGRRFFIKVSKLMEKYFPAKKEKASSYKKKEASKRKLSFEIATKIREEKASGEKVIYLAAKYGVDPSTISEICNNKLYKEKK